MASQGQSRRSSSSSCTFNNSNNFYYNSNKGVRRKPSGYPSTPEPQDRSRHQYTCLSRNRCLQGPMARFLQLNLYDNRKNYFFFRLVYSSVSQVIRMGLLHLPSLMAVMTQHTLQLPHRLAHTMGRVDYGALVMSLKSGLLFETTTAVNNLLIMTNEESIVMPLGRWGTELLDALLELFWSYAWALNNLPSTDPNDAYDEANPLPRLRPILAILDKIPDVSGAL